LDIPKPSDVKKKLSPERLRIARIFKTHIERAIAESGRGYDVSLQGRFDGKPIRIEIEIDSESEMP
jgi:hypothetical protein